MSEIMTAAKEMTNYMYRNWLNVCTFNRLINDWLTD